MVQAGSTSKAGRTVLLELAYDGRAYSGLAVQSNARTVGGELLRAIQHFDANVTTLHVASRTDAGVHARTQRVAFDTERELPMRGWVLGLAQRLPDDIVVREAAAAPFGFKPRFRTVTKRYRYLVLRDRIDDPLLAGRAWRVDGIDGDAHLQRLKAELQLADGRHDFAAFASAADKREHTERELSQLSVTASADNPRLVALDVTGDGFLHNMVRILVGTVVDVARDRLEPGAIRRAFASLDRRDLGVTAPPDGLYLEAIELDEEPTGERWPPAV